MFSKLPLAIALGVVGGDLNSDSYHNQTMPLQWKQCIVYFLANFNCLCLGFFHCNCSCFNCFYFQFLFPLTWLSLFPFLTTCISIALVANVSMAYLVYFSFHPLQLCLVFFFISFGTCRCQWLFLAISIIAQLSLLVTSKVISIAFDKSCHSSC